jgi:Xaa-Pro dipeptidase
MDLQLIQAELRQQGLAAWLIHDFRGSNPILGRLLPGKRWTTRRVELFIPASGWPVLLVHGIDAAQFASVGPEHGLKTIVYTGWRELESHLSELLAGGGRVAMEYSPRGALPVAGIVDAGTVELVRSLNAEVVSSADLVQASVAVWTPGARAAHTRAAQGTERAKDAAFSAIRGALASGRAVSETDIQRVMMDSFRRDGLEATEPPIVAVNAHAGDPHYEPREGSAAAIRRGDWVLIDLWARVPGEENIFSDITWVAFAGPRERVPAGHRAVFETVKRARDAAVLLAQQRWAEPRPVRGWELDDAARGVLEGSEFRPFVRHRTGHSLSPGPMVHGLGMNLDNLETHDDRLMLPGIGFTVEPGLYLPDLGVRLELNMWVDPSAGPEITSCVQDEIVALA